MPPRLLLLLLGLCACGPGSLNDVDGDGVDFDAPVPDCDDGDARVHPGALEAADGLDNDCDLDVDEDTVLSDDDGDGQNELGGDCDDTDATVWGGAAERADGLDQDCDGTIDEQTSAYDDDGDGWTEDGGDCDDADRDVRPGATELCDGVDQDCDGAPDVLGTWFHDADGDGFGDAAQTTEACAQPPGYVANAADCDDADTGAHPGAAERCNDADDDCDGTGDTFHDWYPDADGDGFGGGVGLSDCDQPYGHVATASDCDDADAAVSPGATETCNHADDDCDGTDDDGLARTWYADADGDGFGDASVTTADCAQPDDTVANDDDCDDDAGERHPGAEEACDDLDNDCDGDVDEGLDRTWYRDSDGDGFGNADRTREACVQPEDYVANDDDCDDGDQTVSPGGDESCNGVDDDCDGTIDSAEVCPCDVYDNWGGHAYMFCTGGKSWSDAQSACEDYGYTLAKIETAAEQAELAGHLVSGYWWIGLEQASSTTWSWQDGEEISEATADYWGFASGEPNNEDGDEDCTDMDPGRSWAWNDETCSCSQPYICEAGE